MPYRERPEARYAYFTALRERRLQNLDKCLCEGFFRNGFHFYLDVMAEDTVREQASQSVRRQARVTR
jgi:hypothetical protein